jgi:hypothetical protein
LHRTPGILQPTRSWRPRLQHHRRVMRHRRVAQRAPPHAELHRLHAWQSLPQTRPRRYGRVVGTCAFAGLPSPVPGRLPVGRPPSVTCRLLSWLLAYASGLDRIVGSCAMLAVYTHFELFRPRRQSASPYDFRKEVYSGTIEDGEAEPRQGDCEASAGTIRRGYRGLSDSTNHETVEDEIAIAATLDSLQCPSSQSKVAVAFDPVDHADGVPLVGFFEKAVPRHRRIAGAYEATPSNRGLQVCSSLRRAKSAHGNGAECTLVNRIVQVLPAVVSSSPAYRLRGECRGFSRHGRNACTRCPQVVTQRMNTPVMT